MYFVSKSDAHIYHCCCCCCRFISVGVCSGFNEGKAYKQKNNYTKSMHITSYTYMRTYDRLCPSNIFVWCHSQNIGTHFQHSHLGLPENEWNQIGSVVLYTSWARMPYVFVYTCLSLLCVQFLQFFPAINLNARARKGFMCRKSNDCHCSL